MTEPIEQQNTGYTLASWLDEWLITYKECSVKEATYKNYAYAVSLIKKIPESFSPIDKLNDLDIQKILNKVFVSRSMNTKKYSKSTLKTVRLTLRQAFRRALKLHLVKENISDGLVLPDAATKKILPLTMDEQEVVENACHTDPLGHLFIFLLRTGVRRSELINLKWDEYSSTLHEINITKSKTAAGIRTISLLSDAEKIIQDQPHINDFIFNNTKHTPVTASVLKRLYQRLRRKTGINHLTNHVCRHTFVTRLCEKGVNPKAIAQIIGHAKIDYVMDIYAMIEKKQLQKEIHKLEDNEPKEQKQQNRMVELPSAVYTIASAYAETAGLTVDALISKAIMHSISEKLLK